MKYILTLEEISRIKEYLNGNLELTSQYNKHEKYNFIKKVKNFCVVDDKLYLISNDIKKEVIANDDYLKQKEIFKKLHFPDHTGMKAMYENSKHMYAGFKRENLNNFVLQCLTCKKYEPLPRIIPIKPIISKQPWDIVQMDCIDLRNYQEVNNGYAWILNILDLYSKYLYSIPLKQKTAVNVKDSLENIIFIEGAPRAIQTDNGKEFANNTMQNFLNSKNIEFIRGRPRHPMNQGQVERVNQTITRKIAKALSDNVEKCWINVHRDIVFKYNTTWHRAINTTPMKAFRGRIGVNINDLTNNNIDSVSICEINDSEISDASNSPSINILDMVVNDSVNEEYRRRYINKMVNDANVHYHSINFNPGDFVLIAKSFDTNQKTKKEKMDGFFEDEIWIVVERRGTDTFLIKHSKNDNLKKVVSKNRIKKCTDGMGIAITK